MDGLACSSSPADSTAWEPFRATETSGPADDFVALLRWARRGEERGELLFAAMAETAANAQQREALKLLTELERMVGGRLDGLVAQHDAAAPLSPEQRAATVELGRDLVQGGWGSFLELFPAETTKALDRYARLRRVADDPDLPELVLLTVHEQALADFAALQLGGDHDGALAIIRQVL